MWYRTRSLIKINWNFPQMLSNFYQIESNFHIDTIFPVQLNHCLYFTYKCRQVSSVNFTGRLAYLFSLKPVNFTKQKDFFLFQKGRNFFKSNGICLCSSVLFIFNFQKLEKIPLIYMNSFLRSTPLFYPDLQFWQGTWSNLKC